MNTIPQPALEAITGDGLKSFFSGLLPNFEKKRIMEDLSVSFKELEVLEELYSVIGSDYNKVMSTEFKTLVKEMGKNVPNFRGDVMTYLSGIIKARLSEKAKLEKFVDEIYGPVVLKDAMDYRKLHMLRYIDGFTFFNTYARKLLLVATDKLVKMDKSKQGLKTAASVVDKLDNEYVMDYRNIRSFAYVTGALSHDIKEIRLALSKMAKVNFSPENHAVVVADKGSMADPLRLGLMPGVGSLIYFIGMNYNVYLVKRQEMMIEEKEKLQVKILLLNRLLEGETDKAAIAKLDKQISYYDNRINKLASQLEDLQEED